MSEIIPFPGVQSLLSNTELQEAETAMSEALNELKQFTIEDAGRDWEPLFMYFFKLNNVLHAAIKIHEAKHKRKT